MQYPSRFGSNEIITESSLDSDERNNLHDSDFGLPNKRKYPLSDEVHVLQAVRFFKDCPEADRSELAINIVNKAKEFGLAWERWNVLKHYLPRSFAESASTNELIQVKHFPYGKVYFGSPMDFDTILRSGEIPVPMKILFVTPYLGIASIFTTDKRRYNIPRGSYNIGYEEWLKPVSELYQPLDEVHVIIEGDPDHPTEQFESHGYIYEIDVKEMRDSIYRYPWMDPEREFLICGIDSIPYNNKIRHNMICHVTGGPSRTNIQTESYQSQLSSAYKITQMEELYQFIKKCEYGFIDSDGKRVYNPTEDDFKTYRYSSPQEFKNNKIGTCWDFCAYEYSVLRSYGIKCKLLFINTLFAENDFDTHTFVIAQLNPNNFYYIEGAFRRFMGIYHIYTENEEEVIDVISQTVARNMLSQRKEYNKAKYWVYSYEDNQPPYGCTCVEFMDHIWDNGKVIISNKSISTNTKLDSSLKMICESDVERVNDKGEPVPEKCDKCGSDIGVFLRGEPVWLCKNKKCEKYFGTVPCNIQESYEGETILKDHIKLIPATSSDIPNMTKWTIDSIKLGYPNETIPPEEMDKIEAEMRKDAEESVWKTKMIQYDGQTIGMLTAYHIEDPAYTGWYIGEIYIIEEFRGKGIGRYLLQDEINHHDEIMLNVYKANKGAIKLYKSLGFEIVQETEDRFIMKYVKFDKDSDVVQEYCYRLNNTQPQKDDVVIACRDLARAWSKFKYGIPIDGKIHNVPSVEYFNQHYHFLSPDEFERVGGGVCWDYVEWGVKFLRDRGIKCEQYYIYTDTKDEDTHTIILCKSGGRWIYPEGAFQLVADEIDGVAVFDDIKEVFEFIVSRMFEMNDNKRKYKSIKCYVWNYKGHPQYGCDYVEYMKYVTQGEPFIEGTVTYEPKECGKMYPDRFNRFEEQSLIFNEAEEPDIDEGEENENEDENVDTDTDEKLDNNENTDTEEVSTVEEKEERIDLSSFGTDTDGTTPNNEYDENEIQTLNSLIADENKAVGMYFDGAKNTKNPLLARIYADIGGEERFHAEQLMYAKSVITGEKYEPQDPDVKREYEELVNMGMDEETAMATAIDKTNLGEDADATEEMQEIEEDVATIESAIDAQISSNEMMMLICESKSFSLTEMSRSIDIFMESSGVYMEDVQNVNMKTQSGQSKNPISLILRGIVAVGRLITTLASKFKYFIKKIGAKASNKMAWIKKNGIKGLFAKGIHMYFYDPAKPGDMSTDPIRYIELMTKVTKMIANQFGMGGSIQMGNFTPMYHGTPIPCKNLDEGLANLKGVVLNKSKIVITDANQDGIAQDFFKITNQKAIDGQSYNVYNAYVGIFTILQNYSKNATEFTEALQNLESTPGSAYYANRSLFDKSISALRIVQRSYQDFAKALSSDINTMIKLNNDLYAKMKEADSKTGFNNDSNEPNQKPDQIPENVLGAVNKLFTNQQNRVRELVTQLIQRNRRNGIVSNKVDCEIGQNGDIIFVSHGTHSLRDNSKKETTATLQLDERQRVMLRPYAGLTFDADYIDRMYDIINANMKI